MLASTVLVGGMNSKSTTPVLGFRTDSFPVRSNSRGALNVAPLPTIARLTCSAHCNAVISCRNSSAPGRFAGHGGFPRDCNRDVGAVWPAPPPIDLQSKVAMPDPRNNQMK